MCPEGFPVGSLGSVVKNQPANAGDTGNLGSILRSGRKRQPNLVFLHGKFHEQRSLTGYSPWVAKVGHD